jgi:hypothetical protein
MSANSKENTVRILKGQDPIQRFRCQLNWHRWTSWEHVAANTSPYFEGGSGEHIRCYCADCGLVRVEPPFSKGFKRR